MTDSEEGVGETVEPILRVTVDHHKDGTFLATAADSRDAVYQAVGNTPAESLRSVADVLYPSSAGDMLDDGWQHLAKSVESPVESPENTTLAFGNPGIANSPISLAPVTDYFFTPQEIVRHLGWLGELSAWDALSTSERAELTERALYVIHKYGWDELPREEQAVYVFTPQEIVWHLGWLGELSAWDALSTSERAELTERALYVIHKYGWGELPRAAQPAASEAEG